MILSGLLKSSKKLDSFNIRTFLQRSARAPPWFPSTSPAPSSARPQAGPPWKMSIKILQWYSFWPLTWARTTPISCSSWEYFCEKERKKIQEDWSEESTFWVCARLWYTFVFCLGGKQEIQRNYLEDYLFTRALVLDTLCCLPENTFVSEERKKLSRGLTSCLGFQLRLSPFQASVKFRRFLLLFTNSSAFRVQNIF